MKNYGLIFITVLFLLVVGMFFWTYYPDICEHCYVDLNADEFAYEIVFPEDDALPVQRKFENGLHSIEGALTLPDNCFEIISLTTITDELPEEVQIDLRTVRTRGTCTDQVEVTPFEVEFLASELVILNVRINGRDVQLTYL